MSGRGQNASMNFVLGQPRAPRLFYGLACLAALALGLASRHYPSWREQLLGKYPGDALWATMVFFGLGALRPMAPVRRLAAAAAAFACSIELLKLCPAPWLVHARHTRLGYLVFGHVFSFGNLAAYAVGIALGAGVAGVCLKAMRRGGPVPTAIRV